jgi:hypothetical protein
LSLARNTGSSVKTLAKIRESNIQSCFLSVPF